MERRTFLTTLAGASTMTLSSLHSLAEALPENGVTMPVLFVGHGSPMNAIEQNDFSSTWKKIADELPVPKAVLCVSAHWLTKGTAVTAMSHPKTIHDFSGFPKALHEVQYPAPGLPTLAAETKKIVTMTDVGLDHDWGLDHGTWSVVKQMYPKANIPVLQLSIDYYRPGQFHYDLGKQLAPLRKKGVLIIGSGNMVHNLGMVDWRKLNEPSYGFDWALEMNEVFKKHIASGDHKPLFDYEKLNPAAKLAIPTPDHYWPLLYILGLQGAKDHVSFFNDKAVGGSLTMTSVRITE